MKVFCRILVYDLFHSNEIIEEIKRDDPDRNKFYFSTQLAFGCLLMYQNQIERLYSKFHLKLSYQSSCLMFILISYRPSEVCTKLVQLNVLRN